MIIFATDNSALTALIVFIMLFIGGIIGYIRLNRMHDYNDHLETPEGDSTKTGLRIFPTVVVAVLLIAAIVVSQCTQARELEWDPQLSLYAGLEDTMHVPSFTCAAGAWDDSVSGNGGFKFMFLHYDRFHLGGWSHHISCAFNPDDTVYDGFGPVLFFDVIPGVLDLWASKEYVSAIKDYSHSYGARLTLFRSEDERFGFSLKYTQQDPKTRWHYIYKHHQALGFEVEYWLWR